MSFFVYAQNTIALQYVDQDRTLGGYTLIYPERQPNAYLINECGQIAHIWEDANSDSRPGAVAYLLENGNLLKAKSESGTLSSGGTGGILELVSWENEILWRYELNETIVQHHDIHPMPNGNILVIGAEKMDFDDMIAHGFDTLSFSQTSLYFETILEINPTTDSIIWQWHAWDHLVQELDTSKLNFGAVAGHPEKIHLNYQDFVFGKLDFLHANAIDYNEELDQIILSVRNFNEAWIIDHSTTTTEAATDTGGQSNKGGDLLYRWGNPHAYQAGSLEDRQLFRQHDIQWIDDLVDSTYVHFGKLAVFNNAVGEGLSLGQVFAPQWDATTHTYRQEDALFLPTDFSASFSHPEPDKNFSGIASSIQIVGAGHVVMCAAQQGRAFELTPTGELAWEYVTPLRFGQPVPQGFDLGLSENFTFQVQYYPPTYPAFEGRDLSPKGYLELAPNEAFCELVATKELAKEALFSIYPNPSQDFVFVENKQLEAIDIEVVNLFGNIVFTKKINQTESLNVSNWQSGLYFFRNKKNGQVEKMIVE